MSTTIRVLISMALTGFLGTCVAWAIGYSAAIGYGNHKIDIMYWSRWITLCFAATSLGCLLVVVFGRLWGWL